MTRISTATIASNIKVKPKSNNNKSADFIYVIKVIEMLE